MTTDLAHSLKTRMWGEGAGVTAASRAVIARAGAGRPQFGAAGRMSRH